MEPLNPQFSTTSKAVFLFEGSSSTPYIEEISTISSQSISQLNEQNTTHKAFTASTLLNKFEEQLNKIPIPIEVASFKFSEKLLNLYQQKRKVNDNFLIGFLVHGNGEAVSQFIQANPPIKPTQAVLHAAIRGKRIDFIKQCFTKHQLVCDLTTVLLILRYIPKEIDSFFEHIREPFINAVKNGEEVSDLLMDAIRANHSELVKLWIQYADTNWKSEVQAHLDLAAKRNYATIVTLLLDWGVEPLPNTYSVIRNIDHQEFFEFEHVVEKTKLDDYLDRFPEISKTLKERELLELKRLILKLNETPELLPDYISKFFDLYTNGLNVFRVTLTFCKYLVNQYGVNKMWMVREIIKNLFLKGSLYDQAGNIDLLKRVFDHTVWFDPNYTFMAERILKEIGQVLYYANKIQNEMDKREFFIKICELLQDTHSESVNEAKSKVSKATVKESEEIVIEMLTKFLEGTFIDPSSFLKGKEERNILLTRLSQQQRQYLKNKQEESRIQEKKNEGIQTRNLLTIIESYRTASLASFKDFIEAVKVISLDQSMIKKVLDLPNKQTKLNLLKIIGEKLYHDEENEEAEIINQISPSSFYELLEQNKLSEDYYAFIS